MLTLFIDMATQIAVIWHVLSVTGFSVYVGVIVCLGALIPLIISKIKFFHVIFSSVKFVISLRGIAAVIFMLASAFTVLNHIWFFLVISILASSLMVISLNFLEKENAMLVKMAAISSEKAARYIQTAIQIGAFLGAFIGASLLDKVGFDLFITIIGMLSIIVAISYRLFKTQTWLPHFNKTVPTIESDSQATLQSYRWLNYWRPILVISLTGIHIGAFNSLLPIYFQLFRHWDATLLGAASGIAGLGALTASLVKQFKYQYLLATLLLFLGDLMLVCLAIDWVAILFGFCVGFAINSVRIAARQAILSLHANDTVITQTIATSNYSYFFLNGFTPLLITGLLTFFNGDPFQYGLSLLGVGTVCSLLLLLYLLQDKEH